MNQTHINDANTLGVGGRGRASIAPTAAHFLILVSVLLAAEIVFEFVHIVRIQFVSFHPLPHLDEWRTLILFSRLEQAADAWSLLFVPHAEHRPFLPRLIFLLDAKLTHETGAFSLAVIDCLLLGLVAIWSFLILGHADRKRGMRPALPCVLVLCIAALLFSGHQMSNFIRGFQVVMFMVYFFAMLSFAIFVMALQQPAIGRPTRASLLISLSCVFGICAAFSMGNGLLVLPILLVMAHSRRCQLPAGTTLIIGIVMAATIGAYLAAPGSILGVLERTDYKLTTSRAVEVASFFLAFLGGPWAKISPDSVTIAGTVTLLLSAHALARYWRRDRLRSYELVSAGLIALTVGSAALAALARVRFGIEAATESRYSTTVLMLYAALLVSFWPSVRADADSAASSRPSKVQTGAITVFVAAALAYGIASHWTLPWDYSGFPIAKAEAEVAYVADVQDPLPFKDIAPQPQLDLAWQARGYALRHKLSVFSTIEAQSIGRPLADVFPASDTRCIGHLDGVERAVAGPHGGFRVAGWAWDRDSRVVPSAALLVEGGTVKGIGRFITPRPDVVTSVPEVHDVRSGFVGYVPHGVAKVTAYVLDRNQNSICRIPGELALPPG